MEKEKNNNEEKYQKYLKEYDLMIEDCLKRYRKAKKEGREIPDNFFEYLKEKQKEEKGKN